MKNKKFLLTIAMIMSLVMAISCGDNNPADPGNGDPKPGNPGGPGGDKELVASTSGQKGETKENPISMTIQSGESTNPTAIKSAAMSTEAIKVAFTSDGKEVDLSGKTVTYTITKIDRENDASAKDSGLSNQKDKFSIISMTGSDKDKIKLDNTGTTITGVSGFANNNFDYLKLSMEAKIDGYKVAKFNVILKVTVTRQG